MKLIEILKAIKGLNTKQLKVVWLSAGHRYRSSNRFEDKTELTEAEINTARLYVKEQREALDKIEAMIDDFAPQTEQKEPAKCGPKPKNTTD